MIEHTNKSLFSTSTMFAHHGFHQTNKRDRRNIALLEEVTYWCVDRPKTILSTIYSACLITFMTVSIHDL